MDSLKELSTAHCVLLATQLAAGSNIDALRTLSLDRTDAFSPEYLLRILLTFLPETAEPSTYNGFALEVATRLYLEQRDKVTIDCTSVTNLSNAQAIKRMRKLELLPLAHESCSDTQDLEPVTLFVIHRAYRIDSEAGLLDIIPALVEPFLERSEYLRTWFISTVLPLLRLDFEYYPGSGATASLEDFSRLQGSHGVNMILSKCQATYDANASDVGNVSRDLKSIVGPWIYGSKQRKRRKLGGTRRKSVAEALKKESSPQNPDQAPNAPKDFYDWEYVFVWLVHTAPNHFDIVSNTIDRWDGPADIDTGGYDAPDDMYLDDSSKTSLHVRYAQAAFASVYSAESESRDTVEAAHSVLVRLAELLKFEPPPDLATSVEMLPRIDSHSSVLHDTSPSVIQPDTLMNEDHPLTKPKVETFSLLQIFVYSAYLLADVGFPMPLSKVAKFRFHADEDDQITLLCKILRALVNGPGNDEERWRSVRNKLIWLWNWGMDAAEMYAMHGPGVLGKIGRYTFEKEILNSLLSAAQFTLITELYLGESGRRDHLQNDDIEGCVLGKVMEFYDNASNGNVTRGGMKKALDILIAFKPYFADSPAFLAAESLLAATHDLSFYALTLQHGVPFRPVNIRVSDDPISLIAKVLDQNPRSYTKLDDLINIGQNLVSARTLERNGPLLEESAADMNEQKVLASRRVIGMAIEAALAEDDFETAYSFVVNRLNPSIDQLTRQSTPSQASSSRATTSPSHSKKPEDDIAWRAAFHAGRHRSPNSCLASSHVTIAGSPALRRLEQRMELLSQALLLAPQSSLPEVLTAWRRCEEEMTALLAQENAEEEAFNDHADNRAPGAFPSQSAVIQPRREFGRGVSEESPMGLFDVARGAAAAISRTAFPLRGTAATGGAEGSARNSRDLTRTLSGAGSESGSIGGDDSRVRKRDMVANAVTGGLASGIGWVLGATPVQENPRDQNR
ncbi:Sec39 domain-containing protein [Phyllosticta citribraziliensis]|uniref:Sec39 domain-containing protein n=1 Tax=Phyllosticta citribraziliensis TaxID=989973 RepID=A0ABR1L8G6_9PEZI